MKPREPRITAKQRANTNFQDLWPVSKQYGKFKSQKVCFLCKKKFFARYSGAIYCASCKQPQVKK